MMRKLLFVAAPCLWLLVAAAEEPEPREGPEQREAPVRETLESFWSGFIGQDVELFREQIDFPLTFIEQTPEGEAGGRFSFEQRDWPALARLFSQPMARDQADYRIERLRLEWLGRETCLAIYDFSAQVQGDEFGGHYMTLLVWRDGWRVAVTSIPT